MYTKIITIYKQSTKKHYEAIFFISNDLYFFPPRQCVSRTKIQYTFCKYTKNHYMQSSKKKKIMKQFFNISKIFLHTVIKGLEFYLPIKVQHLTNP